MDAFWGVKLKKGRQEKLTKVSYKSNRLNKTWEFFRRLLRTHLRDCPCYRTDLLCCDSFLHMMAKHMGNCKMVFTCSHAVRLQGLVHNGIITLTDVTT